MQHLKVSVAVRPLKWSLGVKWLILILNRGFENSFSPYFALNVRDKLLVRYAVYRQNLLLSLLATNRRASL